MSGLDLPFVNGRTLHEIAAVVLVAPDEFEPLRRQVHLPKQLDAGLAVMDVRCRDGYGDGQPQRVNGQVPLAPVDQLAAVNPAVELDQSPFFDALAVNRTGRGRRVPLLPNPLILNKCERMAAQVPSFFHFRK